MAAQLTRQPFKGLSWHGKRLVGFHDDQAVASSVRYSAEIDGTAAYFVIVDWNSVTHIRILFRGKDEWYEDGVSSKPAIC